MTTNDTFSQRQCRGKSFAIVTLITYLQLQKTFTRFWLQSYRKSKPIKI
jgi:hypothetical protein